MRDYSKFAPRYWTGETGAVLRSLGRDAQVLGAYLITCPMANMIGLYYLNLATLIDEVGHIDREGALEVLRRLSEGGYATFDERSKTVFVVEMAKHQIGESLSKRDNRHKAVIKELEQYRKSPFFNAFLDRYSDAYQLELVARNDENGKALRSPSKAPSKPGTGAGAGEGSEGGAEAGTEGGGKLLTGRGRSNGTEPEPEDCSGQRSPPEEPSHRNGSKERRDGDFEAINEAVSKLLAAGVCKSRDYREIAKLAHISVLQAEVSVRQLSDRGRLPSEAA